MHDRPDAAELLEAVERFLREDVIAATEGTVRYQARVAANVVGIVAREIARGDAPLREEWQRLSALLDDPAPAPEARADLEAGLRERDERLCERIRAGDLDEGPLRARALDHLRAVVAEKLRVASGPKRG